jgi:hypothetical protein
MFGGAAAILGLRLSWDYITDKLTCVVFIKVS